MELKKLEQIKDDLAKEYEYPSWMQLMYNYEGEHKREVLYNEVCKRYALQEVKKHLEIASDEAKILESTAYSETRTFNKVTYKVNTKSIPGMVHTTSINKESITGIKIELT